MLQVLTENYRKEIMKDLSKSMFVPDEVCHHCAAVEENLLHHMEYSFSDYTRNARGGRLAFYIFHFLKSKQQCAPYDRKF